MHRRQILEQCVIVLSSTCGYNAFQQATFGWLCRVFQKKHCFQQWSNISILICRKNVWITVIKVWITCSMQKERVNNGNKSVNNVQPTVRFLSGLKFSPPLTERTDGRHGRRPTGGNERRAKRRRTVCYLYTRFRTCLSYRYLSYKEWKRKVPYRIQIEYVCAKSCIHYKVTICDRKRVYTHKIN
jgi:hypothetical protein